MEGETAATKFCSECGCKLDISAPTPKYQSRNASSNQMKQPLIGASAPVAPDYKYNPEIDNQSQQVVIIKEKNSSKHLIKCKVCGIVATLRCRTCNVPLCTTHSIVITNNNNRNVCLFVDRPKSVCVYRICL